MIGLSDVLKCRGTALKFICSFALVFVIASSIAFAQTGAQAAWRGVLRNAGGAPIADARVTLASGTAKAEGRTDANGHFQLEKLPAGSYHLTVVTKRSRAEYAQPVDLRAEAQQAVLTLSGRDELTLATLDNKQ